MMDSRKFKRRKRPQREAETRATDNIAPAHKVPVPAKARRPDPAEQDGRARYKRGRWNADGTPVDAGEAPSDEPIRKTPEKPRPAPAKEPPAPPKAVAQPEAVEQPETAPAASAPPPATPAPAVWDRLRSFPVDEAVLDRNRIIAATRRDPAHTAFDVLRTRLLQALHDKGWHRVVVTSPTKDCGKTFTAANLAISLSRQENCRTVLMDLDLRNPSLARVFGVKEAGSIGDVFRGLTAPEDHFRRLGQNTHKIGRNIALGLNDMRESYASELLQSPEASAALARIEADMKPDVVLYDMPPALYHDDVIAFRDHFDGVLLVVGGGITTKDQIVEVERRLGTETPLLGVVLNKAEGPSIAKYSY